MLMYTSLYSERRSCCRSSSVCRVAIESYSLHWDRPGSRIRSISRTRTTGKYKPWTKSSYGPAVRSTSIRMCRLER